MNFTELAKTVKLLMFDYPFYGHLLMKMRKTMSADVPTAGVAIDKESFGVDLLINPEFWDGLTKEQKRGILHHEVLHVAFGHLQLASKFPDKNLANIAMDMDINQYITKTDLPAGVIHFDEEPFKELQLPPKKGSKFYYDAISSEMQKDPKFQQKIQQMIADEMGKGSHKKWTKYDDLSSAQKKIFDNAQNHDLKEAYKEAGGEKIKGSLPGGLQRKLEELFEKKEEVFDWKAWFRKFMGTIMDIQRKKTPKRDSKRFNGLPGLKTKKKIKLFVSVDTSGSMDMKSIADVFEQIHYIWKAGAVIDVTTWDTVIHDRFEYAGKPPKHINGGGGSDISMVINEFNAKRKDYVAAIHLTDGYISNSAPLFGRHLFIITANGTEFNPNGQCKMFKIPQETKTSK